MTPNCVGRDTVKHTRSLNCCRYLGFSTGDVFFVCSAFLYIVVQSVGAIAGAGILKGLTPSSTADVVCTPKPGTGFSWGQVFGIELFITFVLVLTVFATCDSLRTGFGGSGPLAIGLSITMCHLWAVSTIFRYCFQATQPGHASVGRCNEYWRRFQPLLGKDGEFCVATGHVTRTAGILGYCILASSGLTSPAQRGRTPS